MTVLLLSYNPDLNDDALLSELQNQGIGARRIVVSADSELEFSFSFGNEKWIIRDGEKELSEKNIKKIWVRALAPTQIHDPDPFSYIAYAECLTAFNTFLTCLPPEIFFNTPRQMLYAQNKARQLQVAQKVGLRVPSSHLFYGRKTIEKKAHVLKSLTGGAWIPSPDIRYTIPTLRLSAFATERERIPGILQEEVFAGADIRIFAVGHELIGVRVATGDQRMEQPDYRFHEVNEADCQVVEIPESVADGVLALLRELSVSVAALDFLQGNDGAMYFLEANVMGNWIWYETLSGYPLTSVITKHLVQRI